jgi:DNA polymerase III subunit epsilon
MLKNLDLQRALVCFDLETTGTSPDRDRIVEIGLVRVEPDGARRSYRTLVNPGMPIPPPATAVHGISDDDVRDAPTLAAVAAEIVGLFEGADLCGFNSIGFDAPLLETELRRVGAALDLAGRRHLDAMRIFHAMEPRTLTAAYRKYCGKDLAGAHAALADVEATLEVLDAMVGHYDELSGDVDDLHRLSNPNEGRFVDRTRKFEWDDLGRACFTFGKHQGRPLEEIARTTPGYLSWMLGNDFSDEVRTILSDALVGRFPAKPAAAADPGAAAPGAAPAIGPLTLFPDEG